MKNCENCNASHDGKYGSGRFCSNKCARGFSTKSKRKEINQKVSNKLKGTKLTEETKNKISKSLSGENNPFYNQHHDEDKKRQMAKSLKSTLKNKKEPTSIIDLSKRTITKVLVRMNKGCSRCGWNESTCDIHHINGRKIEDPHSHDNLCILCPNCHRLVHTGKVKKEELINMTQYIGDEWRKHYYW